MVTIPRSKLSAKVPVVHQNTLLGLHWYGNESTPLRAVVLEHTPETDADVQVRRAAGHGESGSMTKSATCKPRSPAVDPSTDKPPEPPPTPSKTQRRNAAARWMRDAFPAVFGEDRHDDPLPLMLGVHKPLAAARPPEHSVSAVKEALHAWLRRKRYRAALVAEGAMRHDLTGEPVEPVSPEHQAHARTWLANNADPSAAPKAKKG